MNVEQELRRLQQLLPLEEHQRSLDPELLEAHRGILSSFAGKGRVPERSEIGRMVRRRDVSDVLRALADKDLVVLDAAGERVVGAYPFTTEETPHKLSINDRTTYCMCAVDALSVSPMFGAEVAIESRCHLSGTPIHIRQLGTDILTAEPSRDVRVGVRWQSTGGCAAHSLCMEMIFLRDAETARQWQGDDTESKTVFTLSEAIEFGAGFFTPLVEEPVAVGCCG